jgi:hypothetical protein
MRLVFAAMLALLATQASTPSVRVIAAFEVLWIAQSEVRQRTPRTPRRTARPAPNRQERTEYVSFAASEPDVVLVYQLPPPVSSLAS